MNTAGKGFRERFDRWAIWVGLVLAVLLPVQTIAQVTLSTILTNGPTAKRINIVVLSEGYKTNELAQFLVDATNAVNYLLAQQPYQEYSNYFNAFAIPVASLQSGSDHPESPGTPLVNTYFNSSFDSSGYPLITIPPDAHDSTYANGQGKVDTLLQAHIPGYDLVMMVVNDLHAGGSGNPDGLPNQPLITSLHADSSEIVAHESGHTFGKLADEYANPWPGYVPTERPNATTQTNRALIKWTSWISTNTPLPTPDVPGNYGVIGLFEGAQYQATGWYRPKHDCKMRSIISGNTIPFCEVCSEQLVKSIYALVRPIDSFLPASTNLSIYSTQAVAFTVTPLQPLTHNLTTQWYTNNVAVSGATNHDFQLLPKTLASGTNKVRAVVHDPTALVRNDPTNLLSGTNTWTLNVSLNELSLVAAQYLASNRFRLTVTGAAPQGFVIQASTNFSTWVSLTTNNLSGGKFDYTNSGLTIPSRYYRTRSPP